MNICRIERSSPTKLSGYANWFIDAFNNQGRTTAGDAYARAVVFRFRKKFDAISRREPDSTRALSLALEWLVLNESRCAEEVQDYSNAIASLIGVLGTDVHHRVSYRLKLLKKVGRVGLFDRIDSTIIRFWDGFSDDFVRVFTDRGFSTEWTFPLKHWRNTAAANFITTWVSTAQRDVCQALQIRPPARETVIV